MAKGKGGSGKTYSSRGERRNVSKATRKLVRRDRSETEKLLNKQRAWLQGKNPWMTIENPNREETNKRFIRVRMNDLMNGTAKEREKRMFMIK